jgi:hypothetical protein
MSGDGVPEQVPIKEIETAAGVSRKAGIEDPAKKTTCEFRVGPEKLAGDCFQTSLMHVGQVVKKIMEKTKV